MNLIGHYACAAVPSAEVRVGAVLPDLASLYRRKVRVLALARQWQARPGTAPVGPGMDALLAGVAFHQTVDAHFHRSPLFRDCADAIQQALLAASRAPGLKRFLPAHVLSELYLDHLLLRRDPGLADAFYRDVRATHGLQVAVVAHHPLAERERFAAFLEHIVEARFVDAYGSHEGILRRMERILLHMGQRGLLPAEREAVAGVFARRQDATEHALEAFLGDMHGLAPATGPEPRWRAVAAQRWAAGRLSPQFA